MNAGIKVSLDSNDATKAELSGLAVDSDVANLQVLVGQEPPHYGNASSSFTGNVGAGTYNIISVSHGFGFKPASIMNWKNLANNNYGTGRIDLDAQADAYYISYATSTAFFIDFVKTGSSAFDTTGTSYTFRYYIFASPGA